jgi:hypothetical protein
VVFFLGGGEISRAEAAQTSGCIQTSIPERLRHSITAKETLNSQPLPVTTRELSSEAFSITAKVTVISSYFTLVNLFNMLFDP